MLPASVGYQCPECVREGRRTVRAASGSYGGRPVADPRRTVGALIAINAVVWLAISATGGAGSSLVPQLALRPDTVGVAGPQGASIPSFAGGALWQPLTSAFTHVQLMHIAFNMLALWFLGPVLEQVLGRVRFLAVYLLSALGGSAAVLWLASPYSLTVGASGAIFGLMGALVVVGLRRRLDLRQLLVWLALNLVLTFTASGISWQGHLGGLVTGAACAAVLVFAPRGRRTPVQVAGLAVVAVLLLAAMGVRAADAGHSLDIGAASSPSSPSSPGVHNPVENYSRVIR